MINSKFQIIVIITGDIIAEVGFGDIIAIIPIILRYVQCWFRALLNLRIESSVSSLKHYETIRIVEGILYCCSCRCCCRVSVYVFIICWNMSIISCIMLASNLFCWYCCMTSGYFGCCRWMASFSFDCGR